MNNWKKVPIPKTDHIREAISCKCGGTPVLYCRMQLDPHGDIEAAYKIVCPVCKTEVEDITSQTTVSDNKAVNNAIENWNYITMLSIEYNTERDARPLLPM